MTMKNHFRALVFSSALMAAALVAVSTAHAQTPAPEAPKAAPAIKFPDGVNWSNASKKQVYDAVYEAVKANPDDTLRIVDSSIQSLKMTGRFPSRSSNTPSDGKSVVDGKNVVDPNSPTLEDMALTVAEAASAANPFMASQIANAVTSAVPGIDPGSVSNAVNTGGGGGWPGGGVVPVPLPSGGGGGSSGGGQGGGSGGGGGPISK